LAELQDGGYRLRKTLAPAIAQTLVPEQWTDPTINHFAAWARRFGTDMTVILEVADALLKIIDLASETQRHWPEVTELVHSLARSLELAGRWGAWQRVLSRGLEAAHALRDRSLE